MSSSGAVFIVAPRVVLVDKLEAPLRSVSHFPANREIYREFPSDASEGWSVDLSKAVHCELITKNFPTSQNREFLVARRDLAN
jgi:hypothetical protein